MNAKEMKVSTFEFPDKTKNIFVVLTIIGFVLWGVGIYVDSGRAYHSYLISLFYFLSLSIGGIFFAATQHVTNAGWSTSVRRIGESFFAFFAFIAVGVVILFFFHKNIFTWSNPDLVAQDPVLLAKKGYLNSKFFLLRQAAVLSLWAFFGYKLKDHSLQQDQDADVVHTRKSSKLSAAFLPLFALSFSVMCFDMLMSVEPRFFSTMFAVYVFAGLFSSTLAMMILFTGYLHDKGYLRGFVNENHFHDLGKLMFAMVIFYAYVGFSQFMLIWYSNLPEETFYYANRAVGQWKSVSYGLLIFKFIVPFLLLLPREAKRNSKRLRKIALLVLAAHFMDIYWMVMPAYLKEGPQFPWIEIAVFAGFLGAFVLVVTRFLSGHSVVAKNDPRLHEALNHHQ